MYGAGIVRRKPKYTNSNGRHSHIKYPKTNTVNQINKKVGRLATELHKLRESQPEYEKLGTYVMSYTDYKAEVEGSIKHILRGDNVRIPAHILQKIKSRTNRDYLRSKLTDKGQRIMNEYYKLYNTDDPEKITKLEGLAKYIRNATNDVATINSKSNVMLSTSVNSLDRVEAQFTLEDINYIKLSLMCMFVIMFFQTVSGRIGKEVHNVRVDDLKKAIQQCKTDDTFNILDGQYTIKRGVAEDTRLTPTNTRDTIKFIAIYYDCKGIVAKQSNRAQSDTPKKTNRVDICTYIEQIAGDALQCLHR